MMTQDHVIEIFATKHFFLTLFDRIFHCKLAFPFSFLCGGKFSRSSVVSFAMIFQHAFTFSIAQAAKSQKYSQDAFCIYRGLITTY